MRGRERADARLLHTLWSQVPGDAWFRRRRVLLMLPAVVPIALAASPYVARQLGMTLAGAALAVATLLLILLYVTTLAESVLIAVLNAHDNDAVRRFMGIAADMIVGALAGPLVAPALGLEAMAAIGTGAMFVALYGVIVSSLVLGELGDAVATFLIMPTGIRPTPQYSLADALAIQGLYDEALKELDRAARSAPRDPRPLLHGARMLRDQARRPEDAFRWFRRARELVPAPSALDAAISREAAELMLRPPGRPERVGGELARLAATYAGTPTGDWAAAELREVKARHARHP